MSSAWTVCAHIALTCEPGSTRIEPDQPRADPAKPQVGRGVTHCPGPSRMVVIALLMRFGFIAHPGFKSPSLRCDLRVCVSPPAAEGRRGPNRISCVTALARTLFLPVRPRPALSTPHLLCDPTGARPSSCVRGLLGLDKAALQASSTARGDAGDLSLHDAPRHR